PDLPTPHPAEHHQIFTTTRASLSVPTLHLYFIQLPTDMSDLDDIGDFDEFDQNNLTDGNDFEDTGDLDDLSDDDCEDLNDLDDDGHDEPNDLVDDCPDDLNNPDDDFTNELETEEAESDQGLQSHLGPTPFDRKYSDLPSVMGVLKKFVDGCSLKDLLDEIPKEADWVWRMLDLFQLHQGKSVYAAFGNIDSFTDNEVGSRRKTNQDMDFTSIPHQKRCLTLHLLSAIQEIADAPLILFDLRPMCRRRIDKDRPNGHYCDVCTISELNRIRNAMRLEHPIAERFFDID
ncbi:hypothetical protein IWZ01DRAFT_570281, partial [Phyllosticta capitalensis]